MSHSKHEQRKYGFSLFVNKWRPSSKKYINNCHICGVKGYNPIILECNFDKTELYGRVIREELSKTYNLLSLDDLGRCEFCANIQDR